MPDTFTNTTMERILQLYIKLNTDVIPQHKFLEELKGAGTFYYGKKDLEWMGLIEKTTCYSEEKGREVVCYQLTEKGKKVIKHLKEIYDIIGIKT